MGKGYKTGRLGEEIRKLTGEMIIHELKDPRLSTGVISVTAVDVSGDGSIATIFLSYLPYGDQADVQALNEKKDNVLIAMNKASGLIKKEISKRVKLRHIPSLVFKFDTTLEYARHIDELIEKVKEYE